MNAESWSSISGYIRAKWQHADALSTHCVYVYCLIISWLCFMKSLPDRKHPPNSLPFSLNSPFSSFQRCVLSHFLFHHIQRLLQFVSVTKTPRWVPPATDNRGNVIPGAWSHGCRGHNEASYMQNWSLRVECYTYWGPKWGAWVSLHTSVLRLSYISL